MTNRQLEQSCLPGLVEQTSFYQLPKSQNGSTDYRSGEVLFQRMEAVIEKPQTKKRFQVDN